MIRRGFFLFIFLLTSIITFAQDATMTLMTPRTVAVGETFRVEFVIKSSEGNASDFKAPDFSGFQLVAGPSVSNSMHTSIINGSMTSNRTTTYSYVLTAEKEGNFNIKEATVTVNKETIKSKATPIEVVKESANSSSSSSGSSSSGSNTASTATSIKSNDILLVMDVSNKKPYKGEAILAKLKLYTAVNIAGIEGLKVPSFAGFWQQEINNNGGQAQWDRETYNGKVYNVATVREFLLFPQQDGEIVLEPATMNVVARLVDNSRSSSNSMFDSFFGGGGYRDLRKIISSKEVIITTKPYPAITPASFSGAVGEFRMEASVSSDNIMANNASNLIVNIEGRGNLQLITEPDVRLPSTFELYKVTTEDKFSSNSSGVVGRKEFTYPFIARAKGNYTIEPVEFTYFNPRSGEFVTLKSGSFAMTIAADSTSSSSLSGETVMATTNREEIKIIGSDINHITNSMGTLRPVGSVLIGSTRYLVIMFIIAIIGVATIFVMRKMAEESKNVVRVKSKRANKIALKHLKEAKGYLDANDKGTFHESVLRAMWGYMADKLNIDKASLSRAVVSDKLQSKGISDELINGFMAIISSCEEARYAPTASTEMAETYRSAMNIITQLENKI